jgi:hypothetical protein
MNKIPVRETIRRGYGFAIGNFGTLLGIVWLPAALVFASAIVCAKISPDFVASLTGSNHEAIKSAWPLILAFDLIVLLLGAMSVVGITEAALTDSKTRRFFYFSLSGKVWRLCKGYLLTILILVAIAAIAVVGLIIISIIAAKVSGISAGDLKNLSHSPMLGLTLLVVPVALVSGLFYFVVRQMMLLSPVIVTEQSGGMRRAWTLSRGQFWRLFAIVLATVIPATAIWLILQYGFIFRGFPPSAVNGASPEDLAQWGADGIARMKQYAVIVVPAVLLLTAFSYGAMYGALAYAYRVLVSSDGNASGV